MKNLVIKVTPAFDKQAKKLLTQKSLEALFNYLGDQPEKGDLIKGSGEVRKLRWKSDRDNQGKRGGLRVLYYYSKSILIILIALYGKSQKENITQAEKNELKQLMPKLVSKYMEDL